MLSERDCNETATERLLHLLDEFDALDVSEVDPEAIEAARMSEVLVRAERVAAKLDAAKLRSLPVWDDRQAWKADGARTGGAWLAKNTHMAESTARERLRVANQLRQMPATADAVASGRLGYTHAREFAKAASDPDTVEAFAADEADLVEEAASLPADEARRVIDRWRTERAPRRAEQIEARRRRLRSVRHRTDPDGLKRTTAALPTETDLLLHSVLNRLMDLDWAARNRASESDAGASPPSDDRTHPQRLADAFHNMVERAAATIGAPDGTYRLPETRLIVGLDYDTLAERAGRAAELSTGEPLTGDAARRLACDAGISRLITKGPSIVLDKGRTTRLATPAQREAVFARDRGCTGPCCGAPIDWCQIHHIHEWDAHGGETNVEDLVAACVHCHHLAHEGGWHVETDPTTKAHTWVAPDGRRFPVRYATRPRPARRTPTRGGAQTAERELLLVN